MLFLKSFINILALTIAEIDWQIGKRIYIEVYEMMESRKDYFTIREKIGKYISQCSLTDVIYDYLSYLCIYRNYIHNLRFNPNLAVLFLHYHNEAVKNVDNNLSFVFLTGDEMIDNQHIRIKKIINLYMTVLRNGCYVYIENLYDKIIHVVKEHFAYEENCYNNKTFSLEHLTEHQKHISVLNDYKNILHINPAGVFTELDTMFVDHITMFDKFLLGAGVL
jgi:hemerythrin